MKPAALIPEQWTPDESRRSMSRTFMFPDFGMAFAFMTRMAIVSEKIDHHPEWFNVYNRVTVKLTTHDTGGLSERDLAWAKHADACAARFQGEPD